jgi:endoglucanase
VSRFVLISPTARRRAAFAAAAAVCVLAAACSGGRPSAVPSAGHKAGQPAGKQPPRGSLFAYPDPRLFTTAAGLKASGHTAEAAALEVIARTPAAVWAAGQPGEMALVRKVTLAAAKAHEIPVIVAYNIPDRDVCGQYSHKTGPGTSGYEAWVDQLASAIGHGQVIVIVEPDALPDLARGCLSAGEGAVRYRLLSYAMRRFGGLPNAAVYLDAGNPGMFANSAQLAAPLVKAGLHYGRGFSANVSNFQWTGTITAWSQNLERALGGSAGAVIDTSRNGNGPYNGPEKPQWCNPPGRASGPAPRIAPGPAGIDAYLWIKDPGVSDGPCNGGPAAGQYWAEYAETLAADTAQHSGDVA